MEIRANIPNQNILAIIVHLQAPGSPRHLGDRVHRQIGDVKEFYLAKIRRSKDHFGGVKIHSQNLLKAVMDLHVVYHPRAALDVTSRAIERARKEVFPFEEHRGHDRIFFVIKATVASDVFIFDCIALVQSIIAPNLSFIAYKDIVRIHPHSADIIHLVHEYFLSLPLPLDLQKRLFCFSRKSQWTLIYNKFQ